MPELPEVDTIVRGLKSCGIEGRRIMGVESDWPRMLEPLGRSDFAERLCGARIRGIDRRGKFIVIRLDRSTLLFHLRMSGRINLLPRGAERSPYEHLVMLLDDGRELRFHDTRKFGRAYLTEREETVLGRLGVEPLGPDFTLAWLRQGLSRRKRMIKPLLLDQAFIAGLGNIYVDEALWEARIHPQTRSDMITKEQVRALRYAIPKVLRRGLKNRGTSLGEGHGNYSAVSGERGGNQNELKVYGRGGEKCFRCGDAILKIVVAQRGTHICPLCQPQPSS